MKLKMLKKFLCAVLSIAVLAAAALPVLAEVTEGTDPNNTNIDWSYDSDTTTLTFSGSGAISDYTSSTYSTRPWESYKATATKIVVGEGITAIGAHAFRNFTKINKVELPSGLTAIKSYAFYAAGESKVLYVNIPATVNNIETQAFWTPSSSKGYYINFEERTDDQIVTFASNAFRLSKINYIFAKSPSESFKAQLLALESTEGSDVSNIETKITSVITWSFDDISKVLTVSSTNGVMPDWNGGVTTDAAHSKTLIPWASFISKAKSIVCSEGITVIGKNSFQGCSAATNLSLPSTLTTLGESSFTSHQDKYICLPPSVTKINKSALFSASMYNNVTNTGFVVVITSPSAVAFTAPITNDTSVSATIYGTAASGAQDYVSGRSTATKAPSYKELTNGAVFADDNTVIVYNSSETDLENSKLIFGSYSDAEAKSIIDTAKTGISIKGGSAEIIPVPGELDVASSLAEKVFWWKDLNSLEPICEPASK